MIERAARLHRFMAPLPAYAPKIRLVHLLSRPEDAREQASVAALRPLARFGIDYVQNVNAPAASLPDLPVLNDDHQGLLPGHWGCFAAFRDAVLREFTPELDFLMLCECDCLLLVPPAEFYAKVLEACALVERHGIEYFSFGDSADLEAGVPQSLVLKRLPDSSAVYLTQKLIGLQCILFPQAVRAQLVEWFRTVPWHGMDIWFNTVFAGRTIGIVSERLTRQADGYSLVDQKEKVLL